jgi:hypothetical protein
VIGDLQRRHVDYTDHIVIAAGNIEQLAVITKLHVSRAVRRRDPLDYFVILVGIDHRDIIGFLVTDEYVAGVLRARRRRQQQPQGEGWQAARKETGIESELQCFVAGCMRNLFHN